MCEPEITTPCSPLPSHNSLPKFQLQPSTPEITPNLIKRMEKDKCFRCHQQGHWSWYCPLTSPNNNHSPVSLIRCRCGHGFCDIKTSHSVKNPGRKFFTCPIKRGARCEKFKWCDDPINESDLQPPLLKYPECVCGAGVCRRVADPNGFTYYFECPIKQDHGSCGYRVSEDELLNNTSIVPIQESSQRSINESWEGCQNDITDNDLGNELCERSDFLLTNKRMRIINKYDNPSPVAVSEIPEGKDGKSPTKAANSQHIGFPDFEFADDDVDLTELMPLEAIEAEALVPSIEAIEAEVPSRLSTPSSIRHRQSLFQRDIGIFPSFDPILVPKQASAPNGDLAVNSVSKQNQFSIISHTEASKDVISPNTSPMSKTQQRKMVLLLQQRLLVDLENFGPHQHESMRETAETTFALLDLLGYECKQFSDHIWDFINLVSSMAEIDKSMENSPTLEEHNKFLEEEKVRLDHIQNDCIKTEALFEAINQQRKSLSEEVSRIEAKLHEKQKELKSCELETVMIETRLLDLKRNMLEVDTTLKDRTRQAEAVREKRVERSTRQIAAKTALDKAKHQLKN